MPKSKRQDDTLDTDSENENVRRSPRMQSLDQELYTCDGGCGRKYTTIYEFWTRWTDLEANPPRSAYYCARCASIWYNDPQNHWWLRGITPTSPATSPACGIWHHAAASSLTPAEWLNGADTAVPQDNDTELKGVWKEPQDNDDKDEKPQDNDKDEKPQDNKDEKP